MVKIEQKKQCDAYYTGKTGTNKYEFLARNWKNIAEGNDDEYNLLTQGTTSTNVYKDQPTGTLQTDTCQLLFCEFKTTDNGICTETDHYQYVQVEKVEDTTSNY